MAAHCPPVRELLAKNYRRGAQTDLALVSGGFVWAREGAELSPSDSARIAYIDYLCRGWVKGSVSPADYGKAVLAMTSAAIVKTSTSQDRDAVTASATKILADLLQQGALPPGFEPGKLPAKVAADAALPPSELDARATALTVSPDSATRSTSEFDEGRFKEIVGRLDAIKASIDEHLAGASVSTSANDAQPLEKHLDSNLVEIFFATNSTEIEWYGKQRLASAAGQWRQAGSIVDVTGYSDPRGTPRSNEKLAMARAREVAHVLRGLGVTVGEVSRGQGTKVKGPDELGLLRVVDVRPRR